MALAAGGEGQGAVSRVLFALGVLLLAANLGGLAAERLGHGTGDDDRRAGRIALGVRPALGGTGVARGAW
jgi:hypothetical protein